MPIMARAVQRQIPHTRRAARRELVQSVQEGMTTREAQRRCPVRMHRTTVYRLLKRVEREGEQVLAERRHGHPVKLRGEVLTWLLDYCQSHASVASSELQLLIAERFSLSVSVSQLNRVRATHGVCRAPLPREKNVQNGPGASLPMNRPEACCSWQQPPRPACSRSWNRRCHLLQIQGVFLSQAVQQCAAVWYSRSCFWERLVSNARGICAAIPPMVWHCLPDGRTPMAIGLPKRFCHKWPVLIVLNVLPICSPAGARTSGIRGKQQQKLNTRTIFRC